MLLYLIFPNTQESKALKFTQPDKVKSPKDLSFSLNPGQVQPSSFLKFSKPLPLGKKRGIHLFLKKAIMSPKEN